LEDDPTKSEMAPVDSGLGAHLGANGVSNPENENRLMELVESLRNIEEYLLVRGVEKPIQDGWPFASGSSSFYFWLKETYKRRSLRAKYFNPEYFSGEAAWNILLDLAASQIEGKRISVTSACLASEVPPTTALRWISILESDGMVVKENDYSDKRRTFIRISDQAMDLIYSYYNNLHSHLKIKRRKPEE
jgi:hypothetical protein